MTRHARKPLPDFNSRPELKFDFQLARELHMTVAEMRSKMDNQEYHMWNLFLALEQAEQSMKEA